MDICDTEIEEVKRFCASDRFTGLRLVSSAKVYVRVEISKSQVKTVAAIFRFPKDYPAARILVELKSKTLGEGLLNKLTLAMEEHAKNYLGEPQILKLIEFLNKFLEENPLCCCADEISLIKKNVLVEGKDEIKLKQKSSTVVVSATEGAYHHKVAVVIPEDYPESKVKVEAGHSNFPQAIQRFFKGQGTEISRQCVEPPLNKRRVKATDPPFKPSPSLLPIMKFIVQQIHSLPSQECSVCKSRCFPDNPVDVVSDEQHDLHVERMYCGHVYHLKCFVEYMKTPPFKGGKKCLVCQQRLYHDKYKLTPELSESRWAHQQARQREIDEVAEFLS